MDHISSRLADNGHNLGPPAISVAGLLYIIFIAVYTLIILAGLLYLWTVRSTSAVRMRGFYITLVAVLVLHAYVAALFVVYPLNGLFKCGAEFWYMNTILPLGIALYQVWNLRLLSYVQKQSQIVVGLKKSARPSRFSCTPEGCVLWARTNDSVHMAYCAIAAVFGFQVCMALFLFLSSRRFGVWTSWFGTEVNPVECRRGFEWIPSVVWQFCWAWLIGPIILFKTRHVKDIHHWVIQTRLSVLASLPGTPMWLAFLYIDTEAVAKLVVWWPPAMWFAPGLMTMQLLLVFVTAYDAREEINRSKIPQKPLRDYPPGTRHATPWPMRKLNRQRAMNMRAFEHQLDFNVQPLFLFAATKDFTAENLQFLIEVREFKDKWDRIIRRLSCELGNQSPVVRSITTKDMFEDAAKIFFELVDPNTAICPINIHHQELGKLKKMFSTVRYQTATQNSHKLVATPIRNFSHRLCIVNTESGPERNLNRPGLRESLVAPWIRFDIERPDMPRDGSRPRVQNLPDESGSDVNADTSVNQSANNSTNSINNRINNGGFDLRSTSSRTELLNGRSLASEAQEPWLRGRGTAEAVRQLANLGRTVIGARFQDVLTAPPTATTALIVGARHGGRVRWDDPTPLFGCRVFDEAERAIKDLTYQNTWRSWIASLNDEEFRKYYNFLVERSLLTPERSAQPPSVELSDLRPAGSQPGERRGFVAPALPRPTQPAPGCPPCQCGRSAPHVHT